MKKVLIILIPFLLLSCGWNKSTDISEISTNSTSNETLTYSNLWWKISKTELKKILSSSGIDDITIGDFYKDVDYYNKTIKKSLNPIDDFINSSYSPNYDIFNIKDTWSSKEPNFLWYNSRITTLNLIKNFIKVNNTLDDLDVSNLAFDIESLKSAPKVVFNDDNLDKFKNIYAKLSASKTSNINVHINSIKSMFSSRGIEFAKDTKSPSMISIFTHNVDQAVDDDTLSIVHSWVLIEYKKKLYFIEKLWFSEPYRVDIFDDRDGLINYLMNMYSVYKTTSSSNIIIFENDDIIDWYLKYISNLW